MAIAFAQHLSLFMVPARASLAVTTDDVFVAASIPLRYSMTKILIASVNNRLDTETLARRARRRWAPAPNLSLQSSMDPSRSRVLRRGVRRARLIQALFNAPERRWRRSLPASTTPARRRPDRCALPVVRFASGAVTAGQSQSASPSFTTLPLSAAARDWYTRWFAERQVTACDVACSISTIPLRGAEAKLRRDCSRA